MCRTTADVTFHLRDGVKWHDGEPFTSADVAFTLTSLAAPTYKGGATAVSSPSSAPRRTRREARTASPALRHRMTRRLLWNWKRRTPHLSETCIRVFCRSTFWEMWIRAHGIPTILTDHPIGTGKYKFVEWKSGQYIELEKNEDYFGAKPH